jgi:hypothetical protein
LGDWRGDSHVDVDHLHAHLIYESPAEIESVSLLVLEDEKEQARQVRLLAFI